MNWILDDTLNRIIENSDYHQHAPEFGIRAWKAKSKMADIIFWDEGNGWCNIIKIIPSEDSKKYPQMFINWLQIFIYEIEKSKD